jgi:acetoin utilization protein AcuB
MYARDLIIDEIPPLKTSDTGEKAMQWMEEFRVTHLPIVRGLDYLGLISEADVLDMEFPEKPLGKQKLSLMRPFATEGQHYYEVLTILSTLKISLVPVLNEKEEYIGIVTLSHIMENFAGMAFMQQQGGLIVLEMNSNDYQLSQIASIVESNDGKILSLYISSPPDSNRMEVTIKVNRDDLSAILQTFARYNYEVKASFHQSQFSDDDIKNRFDSFMNYINM